MNGINLSHMVLFLSSVLWLAACPNPNQNWANEDQEEEVDGSDMEDPQGCHSLTDASVDCVDERKRKAFLSQKINFVRSSDIFASPTALVNTEMSNHYGEDGGLVPKTVILMDYPKSGRSLSKESTLVAKFEPSFEKKLPKSIRKLLKKYNLNDKSKVDVFWNAQANVFLGEEEDFDGTPTMTRLKAHPWIDPDAPAKYAGTRVNRLVKMGIFESDMDIADEVRIGRLRSFSVQLHDSVFSPRTGAVKISRISPSQSFWTLTIDNENPHEVRANATLHWVLTLDDNTALECLLYKCVKNGGRDLVYHRDQLDTDFGGLTAKLTADAHFNDKPMFKKLTGLLN